MQVLTIILLVVLIVLLIYNIYKIQTNDNLEHGFITKETLTPKSEYEKSLDDLKEKLQLSKEKLGLSTTTNPTLQVSTPRITTSSTEYLTMLIQAVITLDKETFKDFRLYSNVTLDYLDYETKKKNTIKIDNILLTPYGILTIKNVELKGISMVDLSFNLENRSKALQVVSNNSNLKIKEYTHPVVEAIHQTKALSNYFISKNLPNAFITPVVSFTNEDEDYKNNLVLLKLENGEYTFFDSLCKINNLLGNSKNSAYMITPNYITKFLLDLKNNNDISRPKNNYSTAEIYDFDLALLSITTKSL